VAKIKLEQIEEVLALSEKEQIEYIFEHFKNCLDVIFYERYLSDVASLIDMQGEILLNFYKRFEDFTYYAVRKVLEINIRADNHAAKIRIRVKDNKYPDLTEKFNNLILEKVKAGLVNVQKKEAS
jgi:hypothetical protein